MDMDMDSESPSLFLETNKAVARYYWYAVAACAGCFAALRISSCMGMMYRLRQYRNNRLSTPSRTQQSNIVGSVFASTTAIVREAIYPQVVCFTGPLTSHFTPPPLGRILFVLAYWALILIALWKDVILTPESPLYAYFWEKVAFRAAWVSVTQLPMVYCLSCKHNILSWITGISYERLNWLHRWSAITLFFTVIVHWSWFFKEWTLGGVVQVELSMMTMVSYGFGAWAVLGWMILTSFGYFRQLAYELFVIQHILGAFILLWLVHTHIPSYASYHIWMAVAFVVLDWTARGIVFAWRNLKWRKSGYDLDAREFPGGALEMIIKDVHFTWRAGQHIYLHMPGVRIFENHPFTIANASTSKQDGSSNHIRLIVKPYSGFTKSLSDRMKRQSHTGDVNKFRALVNGPFGNPPRLDYYDAVVFISSGTGASFTVAMLEKLVSRPGPVRLVEFHWIVPSSAHVRWYDEQLRYTTAKAAEHDIELCIRIFVTQLSLTESPAEKPMVLREDSETTRNSGSDIEMPSRSSGISDPLLLEVSSTDKEAYHTVRDRALEARGEHSTVVYGRRPSPDELIRPAIEAARGESAVVVCGSASLVANIRTYVSYISDERAVHKGTGAQGVFLFTEKYDW